MADVDKTKVDLVRLQDDVAQMGQGLIADRDGEQLGRGDVGVIAIRRLWTREIGAFLKGQPTKTWKRDASIVPRAWGLAGNPARIGGDGMGTHPGRRGDRRAPACRDRRTTQGAARRR